MSLPSLPPIYQATEEPQDLDEQAPEATEPIFVPGRITFRQRLKRLAVAFLSFETKAGNKAWKELIMDMYALQARLEAEKVARKGEPEYTWGNEDERKTYQKYLDDLCAIEACIISQIGSGSARADSEAKLYGKTLVPLHKRAERFRNIVRLNPNHYAHITAAREGARSLKHESFDCYHVEFERWSSLFPMDLVKVLDTRPTFGLEESSTARGAPAIDDYWYFCVK